MNLVTDNTQNDVNAGKRLTVTQITSGAVDFWCGFPSFSTH